MKRFLTWIVVVVAVVMGSGSALAEKQTAKDFTVHVLSEDEWGETEYLIPSNPEGNFDRMCRKGRNGEFPWLRKGASFRLLDGNLLRIGRVKVVDAKFERKKYKYPLQGHCIYTLRAKKVPKRNFYCAKLPNGWTYRLTGYTQFEPSEFNNKFGALDRHPDKINCAS